MTGRSALERKAIEMTFTPWPSRGMIRLLGPISGCPLTPHIIAMLGP